MYTSYFGLTEKPFAISPNPKYLFMSEAHKEALAHLLFGINGEGCISLLTGDVGTGKTTVCRCLLDQAPPNTDIAIILNPKLSILDLLLTICEELGIQVKSRAPTVKTYTDAINTHLLKSHAKGRNTALIIDEAQNLEIGILEHIRLLTNLETNTKKLLQIILIGQPELRELLENPKLLQVNQRVTARFHLGPLQGDDVNRYIQHRIAVAGGAQNNRLFDPPSVQYLAKVSKGVPRIINLLCDRGLLGAYAENKEKVTLKIAQKAVRELRSGPSAKPTVSNKIIFLLVLPVILIGTSIYFFWSTTTGRNLIENFVAQPVSDTPQQVKSVEEPEAQEPTTIKIHPLKNEPSDVQKAASTAENDASIEEE